MGRAGLVVWSGVIQPNCALGEIRLRCVTQPDPLQALLLDRLAVTLPKRLRIDQTDLALRLSA